MSSLASCTAIGKASDAVPDRYSMFFGLVDDDEDARPET